MGSRLAKEWHAETAPPCEAHRATSKDVRATVHFSKSNMGLRKMHERGPPQSVCPAHAVTNLVLKRKKQVFSGSDGGLSRGVWTGPFTGFSTSSTLTLWILSEHSKAAACLMCPVTALDPTPASVHWPQELRTFPFLNEDIIMDGLCHWEAASLRHTLLVRKVFHLKLTAWQIWQQRKSSRVETEREKIICPLDRCSEDGSSHRLPAFRLRLLSEFSLLRLVVRSTATPPRVMPHQQELQSRLCGDHRDASLQSLLRQ